MRAFGNRFGMNYDLVKEGKMPGLKYRRWILVFCLLACSHALAEPKSGPAVSSPGGLPRLHAGEKFIYDSAGRVVLLRGANVPGYHTFPFPCGAKDVEVLKSFGFNFIRLGISWQYAEPEQGHYDRQYMEAIVSFIREAGKAGIYVMPEVHQIGWGATDGGIPAWLCEKPPKNGGDLLAVARESNRFWSRPELQDQMLGFWKYLTRNFQGLDNIFGYNVLNEPGSTDCFFYGCFEKKLFPFYERAIKVMREKDPEMPVILEPCVFAFIFPADTRPFTEPNIVYSPHPYFFHIYTGSGRLVVVEREPPEELAEKYERDIDEAKRMNAPLLIGEFGGPENRKFTRQWLEQSLNLQDRHFLGSAVWAYDPPDQNWSIVDPELKPREFYWQTLHRAYPRFTAGTPLKLYFSLKQREFLYRFKPAPGLNAPSEIYIPAEFMSGASVKVSAGRWEYDAGEQLLLVWDDAGAKEISIRLKF